MNCTLKQPPETQTFLLEFALKTENLRVPLSGSIEITRRCNLSCVHCYLGDTRQDLRLTKQEMDTRTWKRIIDEVVDQGCLFLLFTGGEPMIRKDFVEIYRHARKAGMIVTVFSNGTRISDDIIKVFREYPPYRVEISIYGATPGTYQTITQRSGEFEKCIQAIHRLQKNNIPFELKTILMIQNRHEVFLMQRMADDLGVRFRFDPAIFPCLNGDKRPLGFRVHPSEAVEMELASEKNRKSWLNFADRMKGVTLSENLYECSAGLNNFHIDPWGVLQPCLLVTDIGYDLRNGSFRHGWQTAIPKIWEKKTPKDFKCRNCEKRAYCGFCPAFFRLETGSEAQVSPYLCEMTQHMHRALAGTRNQGGYDDKKENRYTPEAIRKTAGPYH